MLCLNYFQFLDNSDESKFIGKYTTPAELKEYYTVCSKVNKPLLLHHLLISKSWKNILCFVNSSAATFKLAFILKKLCKKKYTVQQLSANIVQSKRNRILQNFENGKVDM